MRYTMAAMKTGSNIEQGLRFAKANGFGLMVNTEMDPGGPASEIPTLKRVMGTGYSVYARDKGPYSQECPITVAKQDRVKVGKFNLFQVSEDVPDKAHPGWGNPRWLAELWLTIGQKQVIVYGTHWVAGVQDLTGSGNIRQRSKFWPAYVQNVAKTEARISKVISDVPKAGIVLMGDLNLLPVGEGLSNEHTPNQMFKRLRMRYVNERVVYVAYRNMSKTKVQVIKRGTPGWTSDHSLIKVSLS